MRVIVLVIWSFSIFGKTTLNQIFNKAYIKVQSEKVSSRQILKSDKEKFEKVKEGKFSFRTDIVSNYEKSNNLLVVGDNAYSIESENEDFNTIVSTNLNYKKNLWSKGQSDAFKKMYIAKKKMLRLKDKNNKTDFSNYFSSLLVSIVKLENQKSLVEAEFKKAQKLKKQVSKLVKARIVPSIDRERAYNYLADKEIELGNIRILIDEIKSELKFLIGKFDVNQIQSEIGKMKDVKACNMNKADFFKAMAESIQSENRFKTRNSASLDLVAFTGLTDINEWNDPSLSASVGVSFSIPIGEGAKDTAIRAKKRSLLNKYRKVKQVEADAAIREKSKNLNIVRQMQLNKNIIKKFNKMAKKYERNYKNNLISLNEYLKLRQRYLKSSSKLLELKSSLSIKKLHNNFVCGS